VFERDNSSGGSSACSRFRGRKTWHQWRRDLRGRAAPTRVEQHSPELHFEPIKRLNQRRVMREIALFEADLDENMRHFAQQIERVAVGFVEVNPQTVGRNKSIVGEAATPFGGGDFASATNNIFSQRDCFAREARNFGHESSAVSRFIFLVVTVELNAV